MKLFFQLLVTAAFGLSLEIANSLELPNISGPLAYKEATTLLETHKPEYTNERVAINKQWQEKLKTDSAELNNRRLNLAAELNKCPTSQCRTEKAQQISETDKEISRVQHSIAEHYQGRLDSLDLIWGNFIHTLFVSVLRKAFVETPGINFPLGQPSFSECEFPSAGEARNASNLVYKNGRYVSVFFNYFKSNLCLDFSAGSIFYRTAIVVANRYDANLKFFESADLDKVRTILMRNETIIFGGGRLGDHDNYSDTIHSRIIMRVN
jgi:hypothetical protein